SLHPEIASMRHFRSQPDNHQDPQPANAYEREQVLQMLEHDFSVLDRLGKGSEAQDMQALTEIRDRFFGDIGSEVNPNRRADSVPSTSALFDVLLQGLACRLKDLKGESHAHATRFIESAVKDERLRE